MISVVFTHTNVPAHGDFSRTPDRDFRCFYPFEKFLSHIPVPALGKKRTSSYGRTSFRDVIVMLKCQQIQDFLEVFFMVSSIKCGTYNAPLAINVCHHSASLVMPMDDPGDKFFYPTLTLIILIISQTWP